MDIQTRERAVQLFDALSHPARLRIVELLCEGERTVNEIASAVDISQSGTSQHLAVLTRVGMLVMEPSGTSRIYRIRGPRIGHIMQLIEEFCQINGLYGASEPTEEDQQ
jgi:DNA-binding transcriptional ArsR family regulator